MSKHKKKSSAGRKPIVKSEEMRPYEKLVLLMSESDKQYCIDQARQGVELIDITRKVYKNDKLDGRSNEGIAVRTVLIEADVGYKSKSVYERRAADYLKGPEKEYIKQHIENAQNAMEIARTLFPSRRLEQNSVEVIEVQKYALSINPQAFKSGEIIVDTADYAAPDTFNKMLRLINRCTCEKMETERLESAKRRQIEKVMTYMGSPRFVYTIKGYIKLDERELFEMEFVRSTWDKPDLHSDDINLTINLCQEYVEQARVSATMAKLQSELDLTAQRQGDDRVKVSIAIVEALKEQGDIRNKSIERQRRINEDLNDKRKNRLDQKNKTNQSISVIIEQMKDEEGRTRMARYAQMLRGELKSETERLGGLENFHAQIFGVNGDDIA